MTDNAFSKAKGIAFKLLARRGRTVVEIKNKLAEKGVDSDIILETVRYLSSNSYIDDEKFAYNWARYRIENNPIGSLKIKYELNKKGIDADIICRILERIKEDFSEIETARCLAQKRMKYETKDQSPAVYKRIFSYLMRRGFPHEVVEDVLRKFKWE